MKLGQYLSNFKNVILHDPERKSLFRIIRDVMLLLLKDKAFPVHYFSRELYKKGHDDLFSYVNNKTLYALADHFNDQQLTYFLDNKLIFHIFYSHHQFPLPELLAFNQGTTVISGHTSRKITSSADFADFLHSLLTRDSKTGTVFIKRTSGSYGGKNIIRISEADIHGDEKLIPKLFEWIQSADYLFQEKVIQHPDLDILNPNSLNTLRIGSFYNTEGRPEIISANLRMGLGNNYVDNVSSGGCSIGVDPLDGKLYDRAYTSITVAGGNTYTSHPITGTIFQGYSLPFFQESRELVLKAASSLPFIRLIGWDVAITPGGPVLIEGNNDYDITGPDKLHGGLRNNPVFRKVLTEYSLMKKNGRENQQ